MNITLVTYQTEQVTIGPIVPNMERYAYDVTHEIKDNTAVKISESEKAKVITL